MKKICKSCDRLLDENEFDMWFPAIRVRKDNCKECEQKHEPKRTLTEVEKEEKRKKPN